jgi:hypothetical protein
VPQSLTGVARYAQPSALRERPGWPPPLDALAELVAPVVQGAGRVVPPALSNRLAWQSPYCCGPYCVYADEAVRTLRRRGYRAARLQNGFPEWASDGLPVATSGA